MRRETYAQTKKTPKGLHKDESIAEHFVTKAANFFLTEKYCAALMAFNDALRYANKTGITYTKAIKGRAQCFEKMSKWKQCKYDVDTATVMGYVGAIHKTSKACNKALAKEPKYRIIDPAVSFRCHGNFPELAEVVKFAKNQDFGRHLVATDDIEVGQVLFAEKSFASYPMRSSTQCSLCLESFSNLSPCHKCTIALFCPRCLSTVHSSHHSIECGLQQALGEDYKFVGLAIRSLIVATKIFPSFDDLWRFVESVVNEDPNQSLPTIMDDPQSKYRVILKHVIVKSPQPIERHVAAVIVRTLEAFKFSQYFNGIFGNALHKERFLINLFIHHFVMVDKFTCDKRLDTLYTYFSFLNHSCMPNVLVVNAHESSVCYAIRPIYKGEQLFKCYIGIPKIGEKSWNERRRCLMRNFGFYCTCEWCEKKDAKDLIIRARLAEERLFVDRDYLTYLREVKNLGTLISSNDVIQRKHLSDLIFRVLRRYSNVIWKREIGEMVMQLYWLLVNRIKKRIEY